MRTGTPYCFVIITADAPARSGKTTLRWMVLPALVAVVTSAWIGIGSDERYVFGGLRAAPDGVYETFVHRPLAYRVLVWMLDLGPRLLTSGNRQGALAEAIIRAETMVGVAAVCALVWAGLRRYRPGPTAGLTPCALWVAFVLAGNWTYLEPDWAGALWAVAAIGAALLPRRAPVAAPLAAVCVLLCMATKLSTAPYVLIAGGAVWLLDRRRTYASAAWAAGLVALWLFGTWRFQPLEWQWLQDMSVLFPNTPLHLGLHDLDWRGFGESAANLLIVSPIVLAVPAAAVAMARRGRPWLTALGVVAATVLIAAAALAQGEWYLYQWAALPIFAAGLAAYTTAPFVFVPAAAGGALSAFLLSQPVGWRNDLCCRSPSFTLPSQRSAWCRPPGRPGSIPLRWPSRSCWRSVPPTCPGPGTASPATTPRTPTSPATIRPRGFGKSSQCCAAGSARRRRCCIWPSGRRTTCSATRPTAGTPLRCGCSAPRTCRMCAIFRATGTT
jgi:hypothetical protein